MTAVSVVIPVFERPTLLRRALDSVLAQRFVPSETIVVDDGSRDDTRDMVAREFPDVRLIDADPGRVNRGVSVARNRGITAAQGEWIALLDSDDLWSPDKLEQQVELIEREPDVRVVHTNEIWIRNGVRVNQGQRHEKRGGWIYAHCLPLCAMSPSSIMLHREVFETVGFFDETLPACEDYDLWLRVAARFETHYIDEPLVIKHGGHDDQLSRRYPGMDRFRVAALARMLEGGTLTPEQQRLTAATLVEKASVYLGGVRKRGRVDEAEALERLIDRWSIADA